jgi:hypothetical protein
LAKYKTVFKAPKDKLVTMLINGIETAFKPGESFSNAEFFVTEKFTEIPGNYKDRGIEPYRAALVIGPNGIDKKKSVPAAIKGGKFDDSKADGIRIESTSHDFNGFILHKGKYTIKNAVLKFITDSDGSHVSDFTGYGSLIAVFRDSKLVVEDSQFESVGVAKPALFVDDGSDVVLKHCRVKVLGGKLYDGYTNSADCTIMVAPPWVLGIGGNARGTNLMGTKSSTTAVNCDIKASRWGVMSSDGGKDMQLIVIDSDLTLLGDEGGPEDLRNPYWSRYGSGYGTYIIANCHEEFQGVHFKVGTYAVILRGGTGIYKSSRGQMKVTSPTTGKVLHKGPGIGRKTVIDSDAFGFMAHGTGTLTVTEGTEVNCPNAVFLIKSGGVTMNVNDGAVFNNGDGVILQVMDDDDAITGLNMKSKYQLTFNTDYYEKKGWPSENGQISSKMPKVPPPTMPPPPPPKEGEKPTEMVMGPPQYDVHFNASDVSLKGDIYNGTGYFGQIAKQLYVMLGKGCVLNGAISATEVMHVNEKGKQNVHFTSNEYYCLGHLADRPFFNGDNTVDVILADGAVWNVTGEGLLNSLKVGKDCIFNGIASMNGKSFKLIEGKTYKGLIKVTPCK